MPHPAPRRIHATRKGKVVASRASEIDAFTVFLHPRDYGRKQFELFWRGVRSSLPWMADGLKRATHTGSQRTPMPQKPKPPPRPPKPPAPPPFEPLPPAA